MNEQIIPVTPESETTESRFFWDKVILALDKLSDQSDEIDVYETLEDLKDEYEEDALNLLFSYVIMIDIADGESSDLEEVVAFLKENGVIEDINE